MRNFLRWYQAIQVLWKDGLYGTEIFGLVISTHCAISYRRFNNTHFFQHTLFTDLHDDAE